MIKNVNYLILLGCVACSGTDPGINCDTTSVGGGTSTSCNTGGSSTGGSATGGTTSINKALQVSVGDVSTCALLTNNTVKCWGLNNSGQLGNNSTINSNYPVLVSVINTATKVVTSGRFACALLSDSTIKCWGDNSHNQIGYSGTTLYSSPMVIPGLTNITDFDLGYNHVCVVINNNSLSCWGDCSLGQCGNEVSSSISGPVTVNNLPSVTKVSAFDNHTCVVSTNIAKCFGQYQDGTLTTIRGITSIVNSLSQSISAVLIDSGFNFDLAINTNGIMGWGENTWGELGDGTTVSRLAAAYTGNITSKVIQVSAGYATVCAVLQDGTVDCWGQNTEGQVGITGNNLITSPTQVSGITNATQISVGNGSSCVVVSDGTVYCWGNYQFDGLGGHSSVPFVIGGL